jgi:hypothetical protein
MGQSKKDLDTEIDWRTCEGYCHPRYRGTDLTKIGMGADAPWFCRSCSEREGEDLLADLARRSRI